MIKPTLDDIEKTANRIRVMTKQADYLTGKEEETKIRQQIEAETDNLSEMTKKAFEILANYPPVYTTILIERVLKGEKWTKVEEMTGYESSSLFRFKRNMKAVLNAAV